MELFFGKKSEKKPSLKVASPQKEETPSKKKDGTPTHIQKIEIENLKKSIEEKLKNDPEAAKKLAQIISEMLNKK